VSQEHLLDLGREDVLAAGNDDVPEPVFDVEESVFVDAAQIPRVKPALLVE
jgi:hypothetical protein